MYYRWYVNIIKMRNTGKGDFEHVSTEHIAMCYYDPHWLTGSERQHFNRKENFTTFKDGYKYIFKFEKVEVIKDEH